MLRISKLAIYTLVTLVICDLSYEANAAPNFKLSTLKALENGNLTHLNQTATSTPITNDALVARSKLIAALKQHKPSQAIASSAPQVSHAAIHLAQTFSDIKGHWSQSFIEALVKRGIIQGFPDGFFRPDEPVTRAQFAAIIGKAFKKNSTRQAVSFFDVAPNYWASEAIQQAYQMGFLAGYPKNTFNPDQNILRVQALVSLGNGLNLAATETTSKVLETYFQDAAEIPDYARNSVAAATQKDIVVNYPDVAYLNPNQVATRADVAAFIYQALVSTGAMPPLGSGAIASKYIVGSQQTAAVPPATTPVEQPPSEAELEKLQLQLAKLERINDFGNIYQGSPGITVSIPSGFGADQNTIFSSLTYQTRTRRGDIDDGAIGLGFGFGNSRKSLGVELSYTAASFGSSRDFGAGGFNLKLHRQFPGDFAAAIGYNGFLNIGGDNDFQDTVYGVVTKVFRTRENVNSSFSRLAVSVGLGNGQFRFEDDIDDNRGAVNVFGGVAVRVARPVSFIAEWTGQDLGLGLSITPFKKYSFTITPALRDVAGGGDGARFVLGTGFSFRF